MSSKSQIQLVNDISSKIITGGRLTTAQNVRDVLNDTLDSYQNIVDGGLVHQSVTGYSTLLNLSSVDPRSFVHKSYVDSVVGQVYTAGNGLTLNGSVFELGGTLNQNTFIDSDSLANFRRVVFGGNVGLGRFEAYADDGATNVSYLRVRPTFVTLTSGNGVDTNELSVTPTVTTIRKAITLSDISVDSVLTTNASNSVTPISLGAGQSIRRNAGNTAFEAYTPSSGGGVGLNGITYSGQYKLNGFFANKSSSTNWVGAIYLQPYIITNDHTITEIAAEVTIGSAGTNIRLAVYQDNNGEPDVLIEDSGNIAADIGGLKSYVLTTPLSLTTGQKVIWLGTQVSSALIGLRVGQAFNFIGKQTTGTGADNRSKAQVYGAYPNPIGANTNTQFSLCMWVKVQ